MKTKFFFLLLAALAGVSVTASAQNTFPASGNVGIGTASPRATLHVAGSTVIDLSPTGGGQLWFGNNPNDNKVYLEGFNSASDGSADEVLITGYLSRLLPRFSVLAINSFFSGNVGIGTTTPGAKLDVAGDVNVAGHVVCRQLFPSSFAALELGEFLTSGSFSGIDFHYAGGNPDFSFRMINDGDGTLSCRGPSGSATLNVEGKVRATTLELTSDRNTKTAFQGVDARELLAKVALLGISTWHYTNAPGVRHIGPMAQDFKAAFNVGEDDKHISVVDGIGVALAAIQGLHLELQEKKARITALESKFEAMEQRLAANGATVEKLPALTASLQPTPTTGKSVHSHASTVNSENP